MAPSEAELVQAIERVRTANPEFGVKRVRDLLKAQHGWELSEKRVKKYLATQGEHDLQAAQPSLPEAAKRDGDLLQATKGVKLLDQRPSPRGYFSFTACPENPELDQELQLPRVLLFGGEYYDGAKNSFFNDSFFLRGDSSKHYSWHQLVCENKPGTRSAHQACLWQGSLYIFGGEWSSLNGQKFKLFDDLWRLDLDTQMWEQLSAPSGPSCRSGHRMVCVGDQLILYGGLASEKHLQDLHVFDLDKRKWMSKAVQMAQSKWKGISPGPRSGFAMWSHQADVFIWGGTRPSGRNETETIHDMWHLDTAALTWTRLDCASGPGPRCGVAVCACPARGTAFLFGGMSDGEAADGKQGGSRRTPSVFHADLWSFDARAREWRQLAAPAANAPCARRNAQMAVAGSALLLAGGLVEVREQGRKEREVTLDDVWVADLAAVARGEPAGWRCLVRSSGEGGAWHDSDSSGDESGGAEPDGGE